MHVQKEKEGVSKQSETNIEYFAAHITDYL
jgi:hypothetical protein